MYVDKIVSILNSITLGCIKTKYYKCTLIHNQVRILHMSGFRYHKKQSIGVTSGVSAKYKVDISNKKGNM